MKFVIPAVRAVTVEMLGVLLVLWLLFGTALWSFEGASGRASGAAWFDSVLVWVEAGIAEREEHPPAPGVTLCWSWKEEVQKWPFSFPRTRIHDGT